MTQTYYSYTQACFEKKLRALSDAELAHVREKTAVLANLWSNAPKTHGSQNMHYSTKLALIDEIMEERGL